MGFLSGVRLALLMIIGIAIVGFAVLNPEQRVSVNVFFVPPFENVPLVLALFVAFLLGIVGGVSAGVLKVLELQAKLRDVNRSRNRIEGELTTLRNLPLEEAEESASAGETP
jgi:uncharacterized integral membrane protein